MKVMFSFTRLLKMTDTTASPLKKSSKRPLQIISESNIIFNKLRKSKKF